MDEDQVRGFGRHVAEFAHDLQRTRSAASTTVQQLGESYQGAGYDQLFATWGSRSESHLSELVTGCEVVSTAMDGAADVIAAMKVEAIAELVVLAAEFVADQAAAVATFGLAEAGLVLIEIEGRRLVRFLEQELVNHVEGAVLMAAVGPLLDTVAHTVSGLVYRGAAKLLDVPAGRGASVTVLPAAAIGHARALEQHAADVSGHARRFAAATSGMSFG